MAMPDTQDVYAVFLYGVDYDMRSEWMDMHWWIEFVPLTRHLWRFANEFEQTFQIVMITKGYVLTEF